MKIWGGSKSLLYSGRGAGSTGSVESDTGIHIFGGRNRTIFGGFVGGSRATRFHIGGKIVLSEQGLVREK